MATKWKNIIETGKRLLKQQWQVLVSVMLAGCGIFVFYILIAYRTYYPTEKILYFGILGCISKAKAFLSFTLSHNMEAVEGK